MKGSSELGLRLTFRVAFCLYEMTSIHFQIDAAGLRVLHGDRALGFQRRREEERNNRDRERIRVTSESPSSPLNQVGEGFRMYNDLMMRERVRDGNTENRSPNNNGGGGGLRIAGAAASFVAAGGRRLNLDK